MIKHKTQFIGFYPGKDQLSPHLPRKLVRRSESTCVGTPLGRVANPEYLWAEASKGLQPRHLTHVPFLQLFSKSHRWSYLPVSYPIPSSPGPCWARTDIEAKRWSLHQLHPERTQKPHSTGLPIRPGCTAGLGPSHLQLPLPTCRGWRPRKALVHLPPITGRDNTQTWVDLAEVCPGLCTQRFWKHKAGMLPLEYRPAKRMGAKRKRGAHVTWPMQGCCSWL